MTLPSTLRHTTLDLLGLVQTVSGFPAVVTTNHDLSTTAALRMARGSARVHGIEYNPDLVSEPDYYVVVQCGQILRFFGPPAAQRKDLSGSARGLVAVRELVQREVVQQVVSEIALLGQRGLNVNDPEKMYRLRSLRGSFSGLRLVSYLYVGMCQVAPESDIGFDLSLEYDIAQSLYADESATKATDTA